MTGRATLRVALDALALNKMRSLLTTLGIVIGVAAVVTLQSLGEGATAYVGNAISGLGSNMLIVLPGASKGMHSDTLGVPLFGNDDVDAVRRQARAVARVAGANSRVLRLVASGENRTVQVGGVTPEYFEIRGWGVSSGRPLSQQDERQGALVCVVGQTLVDALYGGRSPLGQELRVHDTSCRVVGVLEAKGASAFGMDQDDVAFLPNSTFAHRFMGNDLVGIMMASAVAPDRIDEAKEQISRILRARRHVLKGEDDDFSVRDPREVQSLLQTVTGVLTVLLASVAAISLLVGGIGIMNIMLVSVTERTREIGIRLAVGARAQDILLQFLAESVALSIVGGALGVALGLAAAAAAAAAVHLPYVVPVLAPPLAFGLSAAVGIAFGVIPARKAARLHPLAALRHE